MMTLYHHHLGYLKNVIKSNFGKKNTNIFAQISRKFGAHAELQITKFFIRETCYVFMYKCMHAYVYSHSEKYRPYDKPVSTENFSAPKIHLMHKGSSVQFCIFNIIAWLEFVFKNL